MCFAFVKEQTSCFLFYKIGVAWNKESIFGELEDKHKYGVNSNTFWEITYEVHGGHFKRLIKHGDQL